MRRSRNRPIKISPATPQTYCNGLVELLRKDGWEFPVSRRDLIRNFKGVSDATIRELARRRLLVCSEMWDGSLPPHAAMVLEDHGIVDRADFREKYLTGKLEIARWLGFGPLRQRLVLEWAKLPVPSDERREIKLLLLHETCEGLETLRKRQGLGSREQVVTRLVAEALKQNGG